MSIYIIMKPFTFERLDKNSCLHVAYSPLKFLTGENGAKQVSQESREDDEHNLTCIASGTNLSISWKKNGYVRTFLNI